MNIYLKPTIFISLIIGAIFGLITAIPFLMPSLCFSFIVTAAIVIVYLKKHKFVGYLSIYDGSIIGAISGFVSFIAAMIVYLPLLLIIRLFMPTYTNLLGGSLFTAGFGLFVVFTLVIFIALLSALFNAFTGLVTAFVYQRINKDIRPDEVPSFSLDDYK